MNDRCPFDIIDNEIQNGFGPDYTQQRKLDLAYAVRALGSYATFMGVNMHCDFHDRCKREAANWDIHEDCISDVEYIIDFEAHAMEDNSVDQQLLWDVYNFELFSDSSRNDIVRPLEYRDAFEMLDKAFQENMFGCLDADEQEKKQ